MKMLRIIRQSPELPPVDKVTLELTSDELLVVCSALAVLGYTDLKRGLDFIREQKATEKSDITIRKRRYNPALKDLWDANAPSVLLENLLAVFQPEQW